MWDTVEAAPLWRLSKSPGEAEAFVCGEVGPGTEEPSEMEFRGFLGLGEELGHRRFRDLPPHQGSTVGWPHLRKSGYRGSHPQRHNYEGSSAAPVSCARSVRQSLPESRVPHPSEGPLLHHAGVMGEGAAGWKGGGALPLLSQHGSRVPKHGHTSSSWNEARQVLHPARSCATLMEPQPPAQSLKGGGNLLFPIVSP